MRACDELVGSPKYQATTSQRQAATRVAKINSLLMMLILIIPLPTVPATCVPKNRKAMKLKKAAQMTANRGESTRVETTVAIEFAASLKPLRKSKSRARDMRNITKRSMLSPV
jgi:hypothetical protein